MVNSQMQIGFELISETIETYGAGNVHDGYKWDACLKTTRANIPKIMNPL